MRRTDPRATPPRARTAALVALLALSLGLLRCGAGGGPGAPSAAGASGTAGTPASVRVVAATATSVPDTLVLAGTVLAEQQATVAPLVSGRVEAVLADRGQRVAAGAPLLRLRDAEYRDQSAAARASLGQALARLSPAQQDRLPPEVIAAQAAREAAEDALRRAEGLAAEGAVSAQELARVRTEVTAARANEAAARNGARALRFAADGARAAAAQSDRSVRESLVRAPFDGEVVERRVEVGDFAAAGQGVVRVVRTDALRVRFHVPQEHSARVREGQRVRLRVDALPGQRFEASVRFVAAALDDATRALPVEAVLAAPRGEARLRPGLFAEVLLELGTQSPRVLVPRRALRSRAGVHRAFVLRDGQLDERVLFVPDEVTEGGEGDAPTLVARGLAAGESVVLDPGDALFDGARAALAPEAAR